MSAQEIIALEKKILKKDFTWGDIEIVASKKRKK